jgi:hypothetical protein
VVRLLLALALLAAACAGACALLDTDPPTNICKADTDCFRAQGEYCNTRTHLCVPGDAGVDAP